MSTREQATMEFEIDLHDDNLTVIRKQIDLLGRQVRETGDPEAQEQLAVAYHNYGVLRAQELAQKTLHDLGGDDAFPQEMVSVDRAGDIGRAVRPHKPRGGGEPRH
ncbi:MAG: hypothetical protein ACRDGM_05535 [bacterium]